MHSAFVYSDFFRLEFIGFMTCVSDCQKEFIPEKEMISCHYGITRSFCLQKMKSIVCIRIMLNSMRAGRLRLSGSEQNCSMHIVSADGSDCSAAESEISGDDDQ